jgi:hypothetical protein
MRTRAVADDDKLPAQSLSGSVRDQAAAAQALIIRMRRDNDERTVFERRTHGAKRQSISSVKEFAYRHRQRS